MSVHRFTLEKQTGADEEDRTNLIGFNEIAEHVQKYNHAEHGQDTGENYFVRFIIRRMISAICRLQQHEQNKYKYEKTGNTLFHQHKQEIIMHGGSLRIVTHIGLEGAYREGPVFVVE